MEGGRFLEIVLGEPDDDCEICRAHRDLSSVRLDDARMTVRRISWGVVLACACPLCATFRQGNPCPSWGGVMVAPPRVLDGIFSV